MLGHERAANSVREDAIVASMEEFYEIYDAQEGDPMKAAP